MALPPRTRSNWPNGRDPWEVWARRSAPVIVQPVVIEPSAEEIAKAVVTEQQRIANADVDNAEETPAHPPTPTTTLAAKVLSGAVEPTKQEAKSLAASVLARK